MRYNPIPGTLVIGFTGHARHGKDLAATIIQQHFPQAQRFAFSDAISVVARVSHGMTTRDPGLLQRVGYEARGGNPHVWKDALYWLIEERKPVVALITGVRFEDEVEMIREMGGRMIRVERFNADGSAYCSDDRDANYPTETGIDALSVDFTVRNFTWLQSDFERLVLSTFHVIARQHQGELLPD